MAYQNNIPQPSDKLKDSQPAILANFQAIKTLIDVNHATFGAANEGKHKYINIPIVGAAPTTAASEMALYTKTSTYTGNTEAFLRRESNGSEIEYSAAQFDYNGWSMLPSGLLMKWGTATIVATGAYTVTFPVVATTPAFTACYFILLTVFSTDPTRTVCLHSFTNINFVAHASVANTEIKYLAFGI